MDRKLFLSALVGGAVVGLAWLLWWELGGRAPHDVPQHIPPPQGGNIRVAYTVQQGPISSSGEIKNVKSIEHHPQYIVVYHEAGYAQVFFATNTTAFSWANYGGNK
jgi:hypothetical protein